MSAALGPDPSDPRALATRRTPDRRRFALRWRTLAALDVEAELPFETESDRAPASGPRRASRRESPHHPPLQQICANHHGAVAERSHGSREVPQTIRARVIEAGRDQIQGRLANIGASGLRCGKIFERSGTLA